MKHKGPRVSVVIPAYQSGDTLRRAVASVLTQDFTDYELIIVDNGSTDSTAGIISEAMARDDRIRGIRLETNQRPAGGRNIGVQNSIGQYLAFLDADDEWLPGKLRIQTDLLQNYAHYDLIFSDSWIVDANRHTAFLHSSGNHIVLSRLTFEVVPNYHDVYFVSGPLTEAIYSKSFINMSSALLRREAFWEAGGFNTERFGTEDIDFWVRLSRRSKFIYWHRPTARCYQGAGTSAPGERWLQELIRYHRVCLTSPDYADLAPIAKMSLQKCYRYLIVYYGLNKKPAKSLRAFQESLDLGFDAGLGLYSIMSVLGPVPFRIGQWATSAWQRLQRPANTFFFIGEAK